MTISYRTGQPFNDKYVIHTGLYSKDALTIFRVIHACELEEEIPLKHGIYYLASSEAIRRRRLHGKNQVVLWEAIDDVFRASDNEVCFSIDENVSFFMDEINGFWRDHVITALARMKRYLKKLDPDNHDVVPVKIYNFYYFAPGYRDATTAHAFHGKDDKLRTTIYNISRSQIDELLHLFKDNRRCSDKLTGYPVNPIEAAAKDEARLQLSRFVIELNSTFELTKNKLKKKLDETRDSFYERYVMTKEKDGIDDRGWFMPNEKKQKMTELNAAVAKHIGQMIEDNEEAYIRKCKELGLEEL